MNEEMNGVLRRVQKLLAIANDTRADPNEAAAAAQQAEKIMRKYQIDHADIVQREMKQAVNMAKSAVFANMKRDDPKRPPPVKNPPWAQYLAVAIARLTDCEVRQGHAENKFGQVSVALVFHGYAPDVQLSCWMFDYLVGAIIAACKKFNAEVARNYGLHGKQTSNSYRQGFITALTAKIYAEKAEKDREAAANVTSRALVVSKRQAIVEHFGEFGYKRTAQKLSGDGAAYLNGMSDGRKVDVARRGVENATANTLRLS